MWMYCSNESQNSNSRFIGSTFQSGKAHGLSLIMNDFNAIT